MDYIWNIYEPCDPNSLGDDPFDIFVYTLRRDEPPHIGEPIYIEGRLCRIVATAEEQSKTDVYGFGQERFYKVCAH